MMKYKLIVLGFTFCCCAAANAAGSMRCHGKIIRAGLPAAYVLATCGPPEYQWIEQVPARARTITGFSRFIGIAVSEQWLYDRGRGKFPVMLEFYDGKLRRIEFLPRYSGDFSPRFSSFGH